MGDAVPTGRIVIRGATVVNQDEQLGTVHGDVLVEEGTITVVGSDVAAEGAT